MQIRIDFPVENVSSILPKDFSVFEARDVQIISSQKPRDRTYEGYVHLLFSDGKFFRGKFCGGKVYVLKWLFNINLISERPTIRNVIVFDENGDRLNDTFVKVLYEPMYI
mgnify:CR=1 FL=1